MELVAVEQTVKCSSSIDLICVQLLMPDTITEMRRAFCLLLFVDVQGMLVFNQIVEILFEVFSRLIQL